MRSSVLPWALATILLTAVGARTLCVAHRDGVEPPPAFEPEAREAVSAPPLESTPPAPAPVLVVEAPSHRGWCESLEMPLCLERGEACAPMPDGTKRKCQRRQSENGEELVCVPQVPDSKIKAWRRARLREIVDAVCRRRNRCDPAKLTKYLSVLALRETSLRPWKRHRLGADVDAAETAWGRRSETFAGSPAHGEPWRWAEGLGYFGQNPALWLDVWDASAEPETLCGEVEAVLVHLRGARKRRQRVSGGGVECSAAACDPVACDMLDSGGRASYSFTGTAYKSGPSWYDLSLVNSGSEACPATQGERLEKRRSFERRCERLGLDPYEPVAPSMLGAPVDFEAQEEFAASLRERLASEHPLD